MLLPVSMGVSGNSSGGEAERRAQCLETTQSAVRVCLSQDKKSVLGELICLRNLTRMQIKTRGLFQETSSWSTHISYCVIWTIQSQVTSLLRGNAVLGSVPHNFPSYQVPNSLLFSDSVQLQSECEATLSSRVGDTGQAVMAHPLATGKKRKQHRHQGPPLGEGRYSVILSQILLKDYL